MWGNVSLVNGFSCFFESEIIAYMMFLEDFFVLVLNSIDSMTLKLLPSG